MLRVTFLKRFGIPAGILVAGLALSACMTDGGGTAPEVIVPDGPDSVTFSIPSETYSVSGETAYRLDSICGLDENDSLVCYPYYVDAGKVYSFAFTSDSLNLPRVLAGHDYSFDYLSASIDSLPCRTSLDGLLKTTLGSGSTATKIGVPASADSIRFHAGFWRFDQVLYGYLRRSDSLLADKLDTGGVRPRDLPAKYIWGGRKGTYRETIAFATAQLYDQCETYFAGDSVSVSSNVSPCGFQGYPSCSHNVAVCSDTGKEYRSYEILNMSNDAGKVFLNTDLLENSNMSYVGKVNVTCPE